MVTEFNGESYGKYYYKDDDGNLTHDMQWWAQLSTSIVFGLGFATVLTLVVTPCALMMRENFYDWLRKRGEFNNTFQ